MSNPIYALTDHDHTEEELAPWLAECATGDPMADGLVLAALDCAWGHWERAAKEPRRPFSDPEYLKAVAGLPWRWDDWIPARTARPRTQCGMVGTPHRRDGRPRPFRPVRHGHRAP